MSTKTVVMHIFYNLLRETSTSIKPTVGCQLPFFWVPVNGCWKMSSYCNRLALVKWAPEKEALEQLLKKEDMKDYPRYIPGNYDIRR